MQAASGDRKEPLQTRAGNVAKPCETRRRISEFHRGFQIGKGLAQRKRAKEQYDITIKEAETKYNQIVASTEKLLSTVCHNACNLENSLGKRIGTEGRYIFNNHHRLPHPTLQQ